MPLVLGVKSRPFESRGWVSSLLQSLRTEEEDSVEEDEDEMPLLPLLLFLEISPPPFVVLVLVLRSELLCGEL